jgi:hypothetical protein
MKLNSKVLGLLVFVILFGGIALSAALGQWNTESTKVPAKFAAGEAAGEYIPGDIRGSYAFGDIATYFPVPLADLQTAFALPEGVDPATFQCKSLESLYAGLPNEIGTSSVQLFVAWYSGLPIEDPVDVYLPAPAADLLIARGTLGAEQLAYLQSHRVELGTAPLPTPAPQQTESGAESDTTIKGKTTFQEVLDWGVPRDVIERIIGNPIPAPGVKIKDYCAANGLSFETVKEALQIEVDKLP